MDDEDIPPRLLAMRVDYIALHWPDRPFALVPRNNDRLQEGFEAVTYQRFARAVNLASWWLDQECSRVRGSSFDTFAYFGPADLRWVTLFVAGIKTGRKVRPESDPAKRIHQMRGQT
jgi:hypothetical protein